MWELDYKESWVQKNWCFWTVVLEESLESPLDCKEIQPVHPKGNQSWRFTGRTDAEAETLILWPPDAKNWVIWKDPDAGKDWKQEEKGMREDEMVGWLHWLDGHEFEQAPGVGDEQESLACCSPWAHKESDTTEWLHWTDIGNIFWLYRLGSHLYSEKATWTIFSQSVGMTLILDMTLGYSKLGGDFRTPWVWYWRKGHKGSRKQECWNQCSF